MTKHKEVRVGILLRGTTRLPEALWIFPQGLLICFKPKDETRSISALQFPMRIIPLRPVAITTRETKTSFFSHRGEQYAKY